MSPKERRKLLVRYVMPTVLSQLSIFLFTIVDGVFIGRGVGGNGLGAVNLVFPFVMLFMALNMLPTVGGLTVAAIRTGRKDYAGANTVFMHSLGMNVAISFVLMLLGMFATEGIARLCGAGESFLALSCDYLFWYAVFFVPCGLCSDLLGFCRIDGAPELVTVSVIICTSVNIFLDWLFVFPLGMGLKGAAIASGAAQTLNALIALPHFLRKKGFLRFQRVKPDFSLVKRLLLRGVPECVSQFSPPVCIALTNIMLGKMIGDAGVNAYSVLGYAASFAVAVFIGTAEGLQPLFGNSYGAKDEESLHAFLRSGVIIATAGSVLISVLTCLLGDPICTLYGVDGATRSMTLYAMPQYVLGFVLEAPTVVIASYLYSTTRTKGALLIHFCRSFVVNSAVILLLPRLCGPDSIWITFAVYESLALLLAVLTLKRADRNGAVGGEAE